MKLKLLFGTLFLGVAGAIPVIPSGEMTLVTSYQYPVNDYQSVLYTSATSTEVKNPQPRFVDIDRNGLISVSIFSDSKGNTKYVQIPDSKYQEMGVEGGYTKNPKKEEYLTLLETITPKANAAIAPDATANGSLVNASSITWSHTNTGSDLILWIQTWTRTNTTSGCTYNGTSSTEVQAGGVISGTDTIQLWYLTNPATGANNIVCSNTGTSLISGNSTSYTGASATGQPDASVVYSPTLTVNADVTVTTVADNSWAILVARDIVGGIPTAGAGTTGRNITGSQVGMFDGNSPKTPAGSYTLQVKSLSDPVADTIYGIMASFAPVAVAPVAVPAVAPDEGFFFW